MKVRNQQVVYCEYFHALSPYQIIFIGTSATIIYFMKYKSPCKETYDPKQDSLFLPYVIAPCAILALLINEYFAPFEVLITLFFCELLGMYAHGCFVCRFCGHSLSTWKLLPFFPNFGWYTNTPRKHVALSRA